MKKLVSNNGRDWHKKLYEVLWAHNTSPKREICMSQFKLVYGINARVSFPLNLTTKKLQTTAEDYFFQSSLEKRIMYSKKLEEERNEMVDRITKYQMKLKNIFDQNARQRKFMPNDEVL